MSGIYQLSQNWALALNLKMLDYSLGLFHLQNFGINAEVRQLYKILIKKYRLVFFLN